MERTPAALPFRAIAIALTIVERNIKKVHKNDKKGQPVV